MSGKMTQTIIQLFIILFLSAVPFYALAADETIIAKRYFTNFPEARGNYNAVSSASDGLIYYVLCSADLDIGAQMYSFNPANEQITHIADLTEAVGEKGLRAIPQGKSHVKFYEYEGKLYFATHIDFYTRVGDKELLGIPPEGYKPYPGGHIVSYDMESGELEDLGVASPTKGGVLAQTMDTVRGRLYGIIWPSGEVYRYDVKNRELKVLGKFFADGEEGDGERYQVLSRSLTVNPITGSVYFNNAPGEIYEYIYDRDEVYRVETDNLVKDYFGKLNGPDAPRTMGYQWRQSIWSDYDQMIYGVHAETEYLFRINLENKVEIIERLASQSTKRAGATGYGASLGLVFGPDKKILYHISHAYPSEEDFEQYGTDAVVALRSKNHHLISYNLENQQYADHGEISFEGGDEPIHINSLALGADGNFYALTTIELEDGSMASDLISFPRP